MTHDEIIEVVKAHRDGKEIQSKNKNWSDSQWCNTNGPAWDFVSYDYRIKPEEKFIPWTYETCPVGSVVKSKQLNRKAIIIQNDNNSVKIADRWYGYGLALDNWTMLDGSPCGTKA